MVANLEKGYRRSIKVIGFANLCKTDTNDKWLHDRDYIVETTRRVVSGKLDDVDLWDVILFQGCDTDPGCDLLGDGFERLRGCRIGAGCHNWFTSITADSHRPLSKSEDLARIFSWRESRVLSKNLTLQFKKVVYQMQVKRPSYAMRKAPVTISLDAQKNVTILYKGNPLAYTTFHKQAKQSEVVQSKQIDTTLKYKQKGTIPAPNHPWRKYHGKQNVPQGDISTYR